MTATRLQWFTVPLAVPMDRLNEDAATHNWDALTLVKFILSHRMPAPPVAALEWEYLRGQGYEDFPVFGKANSGPLGYPRYPVSVHRVAPPYYSIAIKARETSLARAQAKALATPEFADLGRPVAMSAAIHRAIFDHLEDPNATWLLPFYPWSWNYPP